MDIYAKLQDDILILSPKKVIKDGFVIINPGPDILKHLGYKPLKYDERPEIQTPGNRRIISKYLIKSILLTQLLSLFLYQMKR